MKKPKLAVATLTIVVRLLVVAIGALGDGGPPVRAGQMGGGAVRHSVGSLV